MNLTLNEIIKDKIKYDNSIYFKLDDIEHYCKVFNINEFELYKLLDLKNSPQNKDLFLSEVYQIAKEKYFIENHEDLINDLIKENIKYSATNTFSLDQIGNLGKVLNVNGPDLVKFILKSSKYNFLLRGDYKSFVCNYYKQKKQDYFHKITQSIILEIIKLKLPIDYTKKFSYIEVYNLSRNFEINMPDFLVNILDIKKYDQRQINENDTFSSQKYKNEKECSLQQRKTQILYEIMLKRVTSTASYSFDRENIIELSKYYKINVRDFIVFILGKSDQLYHDFKASRIQVINSDNYLEVKKEYISKKREEVKEIFFPYKRSYFTLEDISSLSKKLNINSDDIILYFFDKTKKNLYNLNHNYRNRKRISFGEYKSGKIPYTYIENNYEYLKKNVVEVAVKSVFSFLSIKNYEGNNIFEDLVQEGILYLIEYGNPYSDNGYMIGNQDFIYQQDHGKILYKKCYYFILTKIKKNLIFKEKNGDCHSISLKTNGLNDDFESIEQFDFIKNITDDVVLQKILIFFSQNMFSDNTLKQLSIKLNISEDNILQYLGNVKKSIELDNIKINDDSKKLEKNNKLNI